MSVSPPSRLPEDDHSSPAAAAAAVSGAGTPTACLKKMKGKDRMLINETCKSCLLGQNMEKYPDHASSDQIRTYQDAVRQIIADCDGLSTPQIAEQMYALRSEMFGPDRDYPGIKRHFNELMLSLLPYMEQQVKAAADPLKMAVQYAMAGNYIDFGAMKNVEEGRLREQLDQASDIRIDPQLLECFREEVLKARRMVLFTDNCGEIVTDRLLLSVLRKMNPAMYVTVILRGRPVVNDATPEDALQIRMEEAADRVIGNGTGMPGNVIDVLSGEVKEEIGRADLLVSKGQGNYEGLSGCGLNVFYLFLCKCDLFMKRFHVPRFTGIMTREQIRHSA